MIKKIWDTETCLILDEIKKYLTEQLDEQHVFRVENHLLDCPLCTDAVEGYANHYNFDTDQQLNSLPPNAPKPSIGTSPPAQNSNLSLFNRIAAAILFVLVAGAVWLYWNNQQPERLYQAYHEPYGDEALLATRSGNNSAESTAFQEILRLQKAGNYQSGIIQLQQYLAESPQHPLASMLLGVAYLENNQLSEAQQTLTTVRINHELYYEEASWYLALAYLKELKQAEAKPILEELSNQAAGQYRDQAKALLEEL